MNIKSKGRGSQIQPKNPYQQIVLEDDFAQLEEDDQLFDELRDIRTKYYSDKSHSIVSENNSPDIPFRYSLNPYRGCSHGCSYCYARPTHEYYGLSAGKDFESKVFIKENASDLLRSFLNQSGWQAEPIVFSGVTDCYQPAERRFRLTRGCIEVALEANQPISIVTKNALVTRDLDLLEPMSKLGTVNVAISLTTLDQELTRVMEPRTSSPKARLRAIEELSAAGIPTHAMLAPIIPGLTDSEIPQLLAAAKRSGATSASYILLRLPKTVRPVFLDWLDQELPDMKNRIESRIRSTRNGQLNESEFGTRMRGTGTMADQIQQTFRIFAKKFGLNRHPEPLDATRFSPPQVGNQLKLF